MVQAARMVSPCLIGTDRIVMMIITNKVSEITIAHYGETAKTSL